MNHRSRYREHDVPPRSDIRGSLERHVGDARMTDSEADALARRALRETKLIVFTPAMLQQLDGYVRSVIEGAAERFAKGHR